MEQNKINDIKKALEICANDVDDCSVCPYYDKCSYNDHAYIQQDVIELIAHYESELDGLGEWLPQTEHNDTFGVDLIHHYVCSNCGEIKYTNNDRYCSNCGKRMIERKE